MSVIDALRDSDARRHGFREAAESLRLKSLQGEMAYGSSRTGSYGSLWEDPQKNQAARQYAAFDGPVYSSIAPIAKKIAERPLRVGRLKKKTDTIRPTKSFDGRSTEPIDDHALIELLRNPNPFQVGWQLLYCAAASLNLTGGALWYLDRRASGIEEVYYIPRHWAAPLHSKERPFVGWKIQPPNSASEGWDVSREDIVYFALPNPSDPTSEYSPLQAIAAAVNVDKKIQEAHWHSMKNGIKPGVVIRAGHLPDPQTGRNSGIRPTLTPQQRMELVESIRLYYQGVTKYDEPFVVDGLIEDVKPFHTAAKDLDFPGGSAATRSRITEGFGTNDFVRGLMQSANRASAVVSESAFYEYVVNPLCQLMSEVMTRDLAPNFAGEGERLVAWLEPAVANDVEMRDKRMGILLGIPGAATKGEARRWAATGVVDLAPRDDDDEPLVEKPEPPAPPVVPGDSTEGGGDNPPAGEESARTDAAA